MRRGKTSWIGLASLALIGCQASSNAPKPVVIRMDQLLAAEQSSVTTLLPSEQGSLDMGAPARQPEPSVDEFSLDVNPKRWNQAILADTSLAEDEIERVLDEPIKRLRGTKLAAVSAKVEDKQQELDGKRVEFQNQFQKALAIHAESVGWKRSRLAWLVGFPDPDPSSGKEPIESDLFGRFYWSDVKATRVSLSSEEAEFNQRWKMLADRSRREIDAELRAYQTKLNEEAEDEVQRERARLREVEVDAKRYPAFKEVAAVQPRNLRTFQPQPSRTQVDFPSVNVALASESRKVLENRIALFLTQRGYTIQEGGEDKTTEFLTWNKQFEAGN